MNFKNIAAFFIVVLILTLISRAQTDTIQTNVPHLKQVYARDFYIGCLLSYRNIGFPSDPPVQGQSAVVTPNGGYLIQYHMNSMSPGNNMKPQYTVDLNASSAAYNAATTQGQKDSVDTHPVVRFNGDIIAQLNWAQRQGFTFRGHTLVWHSQTPTAFFRSGYTSTGGYLTKEKMTQRMDFYISEIIRLIHEGWPGLLSAMDVVNEAIDDGIGRVRTSGNDWYTTFGDSTYVMKAFELVRKYTVQYGETQIRLYYNDYNTENSTKADGIVRLLTPIFLAGNLDGIGMQEHNSLSSPTAQGFIASYNKFAPICTEMAVTELDVNTNSGTNNPSSSILAQQANQYGQLFKCFVERSYKSGRGKIISVSKDGLNDQYTFVANQSTSLWDIHNQCKPAFFAVVNIGINYNALDSLIAYTATLSEKNYSPGTWSTLVAAIDSAEHVIGRNYSVSVSADTALSKARDFLQSSVSGLVIAGLKGGKGTNPTAFTLSQNYPNPFNPTTQIRYSVPYASYMTLKVYDLLGQEVGTLYAGVRQAGSYAVSFDGSTLASGVYLYRLKAANFSETKKFVLLK
jgi:endo-1,4-beta-xylanase